MGDHLIVLHSAVRACPGYSRHDAPSILLEGSSMARDTEHGRAITAQLTRRHGTLDEAIEAGIFALNAAGLSKGIRRQARAACEDYFYNRLSLTPRLELGGQNGVAAGSSRCPTRCTGSSRTSPRVAQHLRQEGPAPPSHIETPGTRDRSETANSAQRATSEPASAPPRSPRRRCAA